MVCGWYSVYLKGYLLSTADGFSKDLESIQCTIAIIRLTNTNSAQVGGGLNE